MKILSLFLAMPIASLAALFSGTVTQKDGLPLAGVEVKLARTAAAPVVTGKDGAYRLSYQAAALRDRVRLGVVVGDALEIRGGQILVSLAGADAMGRLRMPQSPSSERIGGFAPRVAGALVDTLLLSWKGKVVVRTPVSTDTVLNMKQQIDTTTPNDYGIPWNAAVSYGTLVDARDKKSYRTVQIGSQVWMAQNLDFDTAAGSGSWCYEGNVDNCKKYGRLYDLKTSLAGVAGGSGQAAVGIRGVCPTGWHLPSNTEWNTLVSTQSVPLKVRAAFTLKAVASWAGTGNGNDATGFRAIATGAGSGTTYGGAGDRTFWLTSSASTSNPGSAVARSMSAIDQIVAEGDYNSSGGFSIRCLKD